jgi:uncharacterized membrane protein
MAKLSTAAWIVHDLGLASVLGGQLFGQLALRPAVAAVQDPRERDEVENRAWRRFARWHSAALVAVAATWFAGRRLLSGREVSGTARGLTLAKDALVGTSLGVGTAGMVLGRRLSRELQRMDTQVATGDEPASLERQRKLETALGALGSVQVGVVAGIVAVTSMLAMEGGRSLRFRGVARRLP